jgi:hypothetical protein
MANYQLYNLAEFPLGTVLDLADTSLVPIFALGVWGGETDIVVIFHFEPASFHQIHHDKYLKKGLCTARTPRPELVQTADISHFNYRFLSFPPITRAS